ncbi:two-component system OmpR family response regulator [Actinoplanes octamycinicus]|uniref:Two-component system OmpR family response regulator n=1 Tax=Actinoplanes octamycinicus TaxID=135948 RepID=A0A7W7GYI0_9ACTN|nr:response regulator transcription factor [Actinoplanes octamycinicus]MBB4740482.1 two-component system OmpR family response regulator [Actinoplanes octamycinicus]GIE59742.1 DNA-binding response regulator [Actinoplanes octamycinicus]
MSPRILVVDDQPNILDLLATVLRFHGFRVDTAATAAGALAAAGAHPPDLVLLDVMLPDGDGMAVCRRLRADGLDAGIILLTARDAPADQVSGLAYGADDYVTKPFDVEVLLARVRAVLRRAPAADRPDPVLRYADLELDQETLRVRRGDAEVALSPTELRLLRYFLSNPGRVLSRAQILAAVWEFDSPAVSNVVDTYVGYLRRKLDRHGPPLIVTHRGFGYALRAAA